MLVLSLLLLSLVRAMSQSASKLPFEISPSTRSGDPNHIPPTFPIAPFHKYSGNPILRPEPDHKFEEAFLYNPTAIVLDDTVFILYRAQNKELQSSIGLAWSKDGVNFTRLDHPIIAPTEKYELPGGCEDPRIVRVNGTFYVTYTAWDLVEPQLALAYSDDLVNWTKVGLVFPGIMDVDMIDSDVRVPRFNHSKSAAIINEPDSKGQYHMYHGESLIYHAVSTDMKHWKPDPVTTYFASPAHPWEARLMEPGPAPIKTRDGKWILFYNGVADGRAGYTRGSYSTGQMLIDPEIGNKPAKIDHKTGKERPEARNGPIARLERPVLVPDAENEVEGQVNQVVFTEGLVQFKGKWYLYFGQADSELGVAIADVEPWHKEEDKHIFQKTYGQKVMGI
ncbi:glycosyl hydrolase [Kockovaella imperatae]|uniref:Glycosyl hydrolase n=1 Tax=Kockovaella imperatae TaxID=4999 RepID=A0A1Y1U8R5_9TREE|nr:glycosyl hydrolase [Kockovaella imperatae]ORX33886.1 glycosyl hydrolase [Kockovaella imperatae]